MSSLHHRRSTCRLCNHSNLELVVPITPTPLADAYVTRAQLNEIQECFPLDLYQCRGCGHVQLLDVVSPEAIFRNYSYFSGRSAGLVKHFREFADDVLAATDLQPGSLVVDIGSNDGTFLKMFQDRGMRVLGIDPAENVAAVANAADVETWPVFFDAETVARIRAAFGPAQVVAANNVFAHTDDMAGMADAIAALLADDGVFVFEVSYLLDVIDHLLIGTIFHEHTCYHSVHPLDAFLRRHGMELIDVRRVTIQGGSLIGTAQRLGGKRKVAASVSELKQLEDERKLHEPATVRTLSTRLNDVGNETQSLLRKWHDDGLRIAGFGAARGGTLILHHFGIGAIIEFIVDDSPDKQGLFSPGHHIPVLPTTALQERTPDIVFILAWVHTKPIVQQNQWFLDAGGRFVTCFPKLEVFSRD
ncbi:MAG TPA: class I SAM-dependent methyltransferase [Planctomycetaceae bacterium]|nr:class I SAM-dependent methyltransferase [Planctomycetaceae bacterium]